MALNFLLHAVKSLSAREVCVVAANAGPPVLVWSDAMYKTAHDAPSDDDVIVEDGQLGFVVRFPGGMRGPADSPLLPPPEHPRYVHGALACGPDVIAELEARKQQIGQLELLGAVAPYYSLDPTSRAGGSCIGSTIQPPSRASRRATRRSPTQPVSSTRSTRSASPCRPTCTSSTSPPRPTSPTYPRGAISTSSRPPSAVC